MTGTQKALAAGAAVLVLAGGIGGGLAATSDSGSPRKASLAGPAVGTTGPSGPPVSALCYYPANGTAAPCSQVPDWLSSHPEALNPNRQPIAFQAFGHNWMPQPVSRYVPPPTEPGCGDEPFVVNGVFTYTSGCEPTDLTWQDSAAPNVVLHPDGTIENVAAMDPGTAADKLLVSKAALPTSSLYVKWKAANPNESAAVDSYWKTPTSPPPVVATPFGKAYLAEAEAYHYAHGDHGP